MSTQMFLLVWCHQSPTAVGVNGYGLTEASFLGALPEPGPQMPEDEPPLRNSHWLTEQVLRHSSTLKTGLTVVQLVPYVLA